MVQLHFPRTILPHPKFQMGPHNCTSESKMEKAGTTCVGRSVKSILEPLTPFSLPSQPFKSNVVWHCVCVSPVRLYLSAIERMKSCRMEMSQDHAFSFKKSSFSSVCPSLFFFFLLPPLPSPPPLSKADVDILSVFIRPLEEHFLSHFSFFYVSSLFFLFFHSQHPSSSLSSLKHFHFFLLSFYFTQIVFILYYTALI